MYIPYLNIYELEMFSFISLVTLFVLHLYLDDGPESGTFSYHNQAPYPDSY
jgi:hypothetical protein